MADPVTAASWVAPTLISTATDLIGGLLGRSGQRDANRRNLQIAREQMAFQERMSNTAYQRAAQDLQAAGLNRILALGKPASTPAGQTAVMSNENAPLAAGMSNAASKMHSALALKQQAANIRLTNAQANSLQPTAEIGEKVGGWLGELKKYEWGGMADQAVRDAKGIAKGAKGGFRKIADSVRRRIQDIALSFGLRHDVMERELIRVVERMDVDTTGWSDDRKLAWAMENLDRVARKVDREKQNR